MTSPMDQMALLSRMVCVSLAISGVLDVMQHENDEPVTALQGHEIQRCYDDLSDALAKVRSASVTVPPMLEALRVALQALNATPRFPVPGLHTCSYKIAELCERALANAEGNHS